MGLAERRAAKKFETEVFPAIQAQIDEVAGYHLPLEVRWDDLAVDGYAHLYEEAWSKVYFIPLVRALQAVTVDEIGRSALVAGLRSVVVLNKGSVYYADAMATLRQGVLTLDHEPCTNVDDVDDRAKAIQAVLEAGL